MPCLGCNLKGLPESPVLLLLFLNSVSVYISAGAVEACGIRSPGAGVTSSCEPPGVGARIQTRVLYRVVSALTSSHPSTLPVVLRVRPELRQKKV